MGDRYDDDRGRGRDRRDERDHDDRDKPFDGRVSNREKGDGPPDVSGMVSLKIDNLTTNVTPDELYEKCGKYGEIGDVYIPRDYHTQVRACHKRSHI